MNEQLIVKNFGPIKDATVDFKRVTVFIGPTGGGKSTLAKLAAIFREKKITLAKTEKERHSILNELLYNYEIDNYARTGSEFYWQVEEENKYDTIIANEHKISIDLNLHSEIGNKDNYIAKELQKILENNKSKGEEISASNLYLHTQNLSSRFDKISMSWNEKRFPNLLFIPADRLSVYIISRLSAFPNASPLPKTISEFAKAFELSRRRIVNFKVGFLKISYRWNDESMIETADNTSLRLRESASGIQSVIPMLSVIYDKTHPLNRFDGNSSYSFIIEEPELNLYPEAQKGLIELLVDDCISFKENNNLLITTHSPYILSSCNLLLEAYKVAQQRPELADEVAAIVPRECWLNPDEFAAYYVADGTVKSITDERTDLIGGNELDAVSGDISDSFRKLLRLKKQVA